MQSEHNVVILGGGPSGIIAGNVFAKQGIDYRIVSENLLGGFKPTTIFNGLTFDVGQRTLFHHPTLYNFLMDILQDKPETRDMSKTVSVKYGSRLFDYPIQNSKIGWSLGEKLHMAASYMFRNRKLIDNGNYADWVLGTYGKFLADKVILPHTWKTLKEDLWGIHSDHYQKKVVPFSAFSNDKRYHVDEIIGKRSIFETLCERVRDNVIVDSVSAVDIKEHMVHLNSGRTIKYNRLINTISLVKFVNCIVKNISDYMEVAVSVAVKSLRYNNMLLTHFVVPTKFVTCNKDIVYFPEREYLFSKVNIQRQGDISIVVCEMSYRMGDADLYRDVNYEAKIKEQVEQQLKLGGILDNDMVMPFHVGTKHISPGYIICDRDYELNNSLLQAFLEYNDIYNVGRFSQWEPHMRVEHSLVRAQDLCNRMP